MNIILAKHAGHCFGVKTAIQKAFETAKREQQPVYTLGPIIHNPQVVTSLEKEGVKAVKHLSEVEHGVIIIRSHGVTPEVITEAKARGLLVVDATCPFVRRAHDLGRALVNNGYHLVILGDAKHPEVVGILGSVSGQATIVANAADIDGLANKSKYGLIAQTTQSLKNLQEVASSLLTKTSTLKVCNTICNATRDLQSETKQLAKQVNIMLVVGGKNSANTTQLAKIAEQAGVKTYHIETAWEIEKNWFQPDQTVGVTAGTSTPDWIIEGIMDHLRALFPSHETM